MDSVLIGVQLGTCTALTREFSPSPFACTDFCSEERGDLNLKLGIVQWRRKITAVCFFQDILEILKDDDAVGRRLGRCLVQVPTTLFL